MVVCHLVNDRIRNLWIRAGPTAPGALKEPSDREGAEGSADCHENHAGSKCWVHDRLPLPCRGPERVAYFAINCPMRAWTFGSLKGSSRSRGAFSPTHITSPAAAGICGWRDFSRVRPKRRDFEQVFAPASSARSNMVCCDRGLMCNSLPTTSRRV